MVHTLIPPAPASHPLSFSSFFNKSSLTPLPHRFHRVDQAAVACLNAKLAVEKALVSPLQATRDLVQSKVGRWEEEGEGGGG